MTDKFKGNAPFDPTNEIDWQLFIDTLNISQLQSLNTLVCQRVDYLRAIETTESMFRFKTGDYVSFTDKQGVRQTGQIVKFNKKTVTVLNVDDKKWNVSPSLLDKVANLTIGQSTHPSNQPGKMRPSDWVAGCTRLPGSVHGDDGYFVPDAIIWLDGTGTIRDLNVLEPGAEATDMVKSFEKAIEHSNGGSMGPPATLRTDNADLLYLLRPIYPTIKFILAEVPEISEIAEDMANAFNEELPPKIAYAGLGINPTALTAFFKAAAGLYKAHPWKQVPHESRLIGITIDSLGIRDNVISIIGQAGQSFGILLFNCLADYENYLSIVHSDVDTSRFENLPKYRVLSFVPAADVSEEQRKEFMANGWKLAAHDAYPEFFLPVSGRVARAPDENDCIVFEAIALSLMGLFKNPKELKNCWKTGAKLEVDQRITISSGAVDTLIQLPVLPAGRTLETLNPLEKMALIDRSDFPDIEERHQSLMDEIDETYRRSPEANRIDGAGAGFTLIMQFAFNYCDCTIASLTPIELEEILFHIIPAKVMIGADEGDFIIDDCVAFYHFLKREYGFVRADEFISFLDQEAKDTLRDALNDSSKFGMGKSVMSGTDNPFDSHDGINFPHHNDPFLLPGELEFDDGFSLANLPKTLSPAEKKSRKKQRKSARKARKKNR